MWGDAGNFDQAGGFLNNSFSSPSTEGGEKKATKEKRAENLVPVTIRQILESDEEFKIADITVHVLTFVAVIKNIETSSTKITYTMEDSTGQIDVVLWLDGAMEELEEQPLVNTYCRVFGTVRTTQGKRHIMVFKLRTINDLNEITNHLLEVIDVHLSAPTLSSVADMDTTASSAHKEQLDNSMMGVGNNEPMDTSGVSNPHHKLVLDVIGEMAPLQSTGVNVQFISQKLQSKMTVHQVKESVDYLLQEGFIFSTVDDEHFTVTR